MIAARDPWTAAMLRGDFEAAWRVCDRVLQERLAKRVTCTHWPRHCQFIWRGDPWDGKRVLVRCYHGLGDTLQFVRLLPLLRRTAREVTLWVQPQLLRLLDGVAGVDRLLPLHDGTPEVDYDVDLELMELPYALRLTEATLPRDVPYIYVSAHNRSPPSPSLRVGLTWRAGDWNPHRSLPEELVARLAQVPDIEWFALQYGCERLPFPMMNLACQDIAEQARRMLDLDLVVSVDTLSAHLAGALGLRTWTLLSDDCDWRWLHAREDSPWYPTMQLIRQTDAGNWRSVTDAISDRLLQLSQRPHAASTAPETRGRSTRPRPSEPQYPL